MSLTSYDEFDRDSDLGRYDPLGMYSPYAEDYLDYYVPYSYDFDPYGTEKEEYDGWDVYFPGEERSNELATDMDDMWEAYDALRKPEDQPEDENDVALKELEQKLQDMQWTLPMAFFRRYKLAQDHGTAAARKGRVAEDRRRKRVARKNRHTRHYTPDHKIRDYHNDLVTWGTQEDRFEEDFQPNWEDLFFDSAGFDLVNELGFFDPYEPALAPVGAGYYDEDDGILLSRRYSFDDLDW